MWAKCKFGNAEIEVSISLEKLIRIYYIYHITYICYISYFYVPTLHATRARDTYAHLSIVFNNLVRIPYFEDTYIVRMQMCYFELVL